VIVAHISDLHVSRFGEHVTSLRSRRLHGKLAPPKEIWDPVDAVDGWRIERRKHRLRLTDERGVVHAVISSGWRGEASVKRQLAARRSERLATHHARLAAKLPARADVERMLADDPHNTNLLFLRAAAVLREDAPDWVLITGDVTDDGVGHDLVLAALDPWVQRGRLLAVPGNHDLYASPMVVPKHARTTVGDKRAAWNGFTARLGIPDSPWVRELGEGAIACGLDSCIPARTPMSASGAVPTASLARLHDLLSGIPRDACLLAMVHHHVVNLPFHAVGLAPWQLGIRLRNAREVYDFLIARGFVAVLNGHRHVGYRYHPSHAPLFISSPSTTLGDRSGRAQAPYYFRIEIHRGDVTQVRERPF
jgi:hypothetical protein